MQGEKSTQVGHGRYVMPRAAIQLFVEWEEAGLLQNPASGSLQPCELCISPVGKTSDWMWYT